MTARAENDRSTNKIALDIGAAVCYIGRAMKNEADAIILKEVRDAATAAEGLVDMRGLLPDDPQKEAVEQFITRAALSLADKMADFNSAVEQITDVHERLIAERGRCDKQLRQLLVLLQGIDPEEAMNVREQVVARIFRKDQDPSGEAEPVDLSGVSIREAAVSVLSRAKRPMLTAELVDAIRKDGREIGKNASSVLSAALSTGLAKQQFVAKKQQNKNVWSLAEWGDEDGLLKG